MKPIIIIPRATMSSADIKMLRDNGLCVVVAKNPAAVKFLDPIPSGAERGKIEAAAIKLSRCLLNRTWTDQTGAIGTPVCLSHHDFARLYVQFLIDGTELDRNGTTQEQEEEYFNRAKIQELHRLAREEAKAERKAKKKPV